MNPVCPPRTPRIARGVVFGLTLTLSILHFTSAGGLPSLADDLINYSDRAEKLVEHQERTVELDSQMAIAFARMEYSQNLHDQLVAGIAPLREASSDFTEFVRGDAAFARILQAIVRGGGERERAANYLLVSLVRNRTVDPRILDRLAAEFRVEFGSDPDFLHVESFSTGSIGVNVPASNPRMEPVRQP